MTQEDFDVFYELIQNEINKAVRSQNIYIVELCNKVLEILENNIEE